MSNYQIVSSITENLKQLLQGEGVKFSTKLHDDEESIPMSLIPFGRIFYKGESFEYSYGMKPGYVEAEFLLRVVLRDSDEVRLMDEAQLWTHRLREALTVSTVNINGLSASKPISSVGMDRTQVERKEEMLFLDGLLTIRYRES